MQDFKLRHQIIPEETWGQLHLHYSGYAKDCLTLVMLYYKLCPSYPWSFFLNLGTYSWSGQLEIPKMYLYDLLKIKRNLILIWVCSDSNFDLSVEILSYVRIDLSIYSARSIFLHIMYFPIFNYSSVIYCLQYFNMLLSSTRLDWSKMLLSWYTIFSMLWSAVKNTNFYLVGVI